MERTVIEIDTEYITLAQFLKLTDLISSGGMAKPYLAMMDVLVDGEAEDRRGKKLYHGTIVTVTGVGDFVIEREGY